MGFGMLKVDWIIKVIAKNSVFSQLLLAGLCLISVSTAQAIGDAANGKVLYNTANGAPLSCANSACHGTNPSSNMNKIRNGANNGSHIMSTINSNTGGMGFLSSYISAANADDIGAYIANPNVTTTAITVSPSVLSFGNQTVGSTSASQTVTLTNSGTSPLSISGITISTSLGYAGTTTCSLTLALAVGANCALSTTFTPSSGGVKNGAITITSNAVGSPTTISLSGTGIATTTTPSAVEFYNAGINHYFMTASPDEATFLDNKPSWGWARTGKTFNVWLTQASAPGSASPVCRFFGVFSNGTVGSHFYTADPGECAYVKSRLDWGWGYENDAFYAVKPTGGSCPSGTSPVYRTYNNGMGGAPNHRYMTTQADVDTMVSKGWVSEGTVLCGAP